MERKRKKKKNHKASNDGIIKKKYKNQDIGRRVLLSEGLLTH